MSAAFQTLSERFQGCPSIFFLSSSTRPRNMCLIQAWSFILFPRNMCLTQAWRFIIDREIEAPDRFQAIQSHRAAMAVLRQQQGFVQELFEAGMVDEVGGRVGRACNDGGHDACRTDLWTCPTSFIPR